MDIRRPKAAHSVGEFLIEIGTIIIGILIALSLEAAVEAIHHHELVDHAEADLRQELVDNRQELEAAIGSERQALDDFKSLDTYLRARAAGRSASFPKLTASVKTSTMGTSAWDSTLATQALSYMRFNEAHALAKAYSATKSYNDLEGEARKSLFELSAADLGNADAMTPTQIVGLQHNVDLSYSYLTTSVRTGKELLETYTMTLNVLRG